MTIIVKPHAGTRTTRANAEVLACRHHRSDSISLPPAQTIAWLSLSTMLTLCISMPLPPRTSTTAGIENSNVVAHTSAVDNGTLS